MPIAVSPVVARSAHAAQRNHAAKKTAAAAPAPLSEAGETLLARSMARMEAIEAEIMESTPKIDEARRAAYATARAADVANSPLRGRAGRKASMPSTSVGPRLPTVKQTATTARPWRLTSPSKNPVTRPPRASCKGSPLPSPSSAPNPSSSATPRSPPKRQSSSTR